MMFRDGSVEDKVVWVVVKLLDSLGVTATREDTARTQVFVIEVKAGSQPGAEARDLASRFADFYCEWMFPWGFVNPIADSADNALAHSMHYFVDGGKQASASRSWLPIRIFVRGGTSQVVIEVGVKPTIVA